VVSFSNFSSGFEEAADTVLLAGDSGGLAVPEVGAGGDTALFLACWWFEDSRAETLKSGRSVGTVGVGLLVAVTGDQAEVCFFVGFGAGNG
jgi:hypothetical protein